VTASNLTASSGLPKFNKFILPNYFLLASSICFMGFACGIFISKNKNEQVLKATSFLLALSQFVVFLVTLIYMIVSYANRTKMFSSDNILKVLKHCVYVRFIGLGLTLVCLIFLFYVLATMKKEKKIAFGGSLICLVSNSLLFICIAFVCVHTLFNRGTHYSINLLCKLVELNKNVGEEYALTNPSMNGFTLSQMQRVLMVAQEIVSRGEASELKALLTSSYIAFVTILAYFISIIGNIIGVSGLIIESFDVDKDDHPMEI
jgi:hypothetical protein